MARFIATIQGQRGEASRLGSKGSGIVARINGWCGGVKVEARYNSAADKDYFDIYATGGSSSSSLLYIGYVDTEGQFHPKGEDNGIQQA